MCEGKGDACLGAGQLRQASFRDRAMRPSICTMRDSRAPAPAIDPPSALPRRLGLWSAVAVVIGTTIGSGIFRSPASITNRLPGPLPLLTVWVVGGALAMCGALTLAEIAGAYPHTGGIYVFLLEGW